MEEEAGSHFLEDFQYYFSTTTGGEKKEETGKGLSVLL
jgi:hypothetical protein